MNEFNIGDWVIARDYFYGRIVEIDDDEALVEFEHGYSGGTMPFYLTELVHSEPRKEYPDITRVHNFSVGGNSFERTCSLSLWNEDADGNEVNSTSIDLTQGQLKSLIKMLQYYVKED